MTVEELLKYPISEIRGDKSLFSDFVKLYIEQGGKQSDCFGCNLSSTYNKWKRKVSIPTKLKTMSKTKNTFTLIDPKRKYYIQNEGSVLNENSTDEVALLFLNQFDKKYYDVRSKVFKTLPKIEKVEEKLEEKKIRVINVASELAQEIEKPKLKRKRKPRK